MTKYHLKYKYEVNIISMFHLHVNAFILQYVAIFDIPIKKYANDTALQFITPQGLPIDFV